MAILDEHPIAMNVPPSVLRRSVLAATAAPSVHNTQPWLFRLNHDGVDVFVDRRRQLRVLDPQGREMYVSVGAALFNLRVALAAYGWATGVTPCPDPAEPDLAGRVLVSGPAPITPAARALADAITRRHTNRRPFTDAAIPERTMIELAQAVDIEGARLFVADGALRDGILSLTRTADNRMRADARYRLELAAWTSAGGSVRRDGVPREAFGPRAHDAALPMRDLALAQGTPTTIVDFEAEPTIALLLTRGDAPAQWLRAGSALQRVWLTATVRGLAATPLSQLTEVPALRSLLTQSASDEVVQTVLRLGYPARPATATPRRRLADVLIGGRDV
jgi:hypothetical protein